MSPRRRTARRRPRKARAVPTLKAIYGSHVVAQWEQYLHTSAPTELEALPVAYGATLLLYDVLVWNEAAQDGDTATVDGKQRLLTCLRSCSARRGRAFE
jgi:hypothetical protein